MLLKRGAKIVSAKSVSYFTHIALKKIQPSTMSESDLSIRKMEAELAKANAEAAKLLAERAEIDKRVSEKWYAGRYVVQSLIGGLTLAGLLAVWFKAYLEPVLTVKEQVAAGAMEVRRNENELDRLRNQVEQEKLRLQLIDINKRNQDLMGQQAKLQQIAEQRLAALKANEQTTLHAVEEKKQLEAQLRELKQARVLTLDSSREIGRTLFPSSLLSVPSSLGSSLTSSLISSFSTCKTPTTSCDAYVTVTGVPCTCFSVSSATGLFETSSGVTVARTISPGLTTGTISNPTIQPNVPPSGRR